MAGPESRYQHITAKQIKFAILVGAGKEYGEAHLEAYPNKMSFKTHQEAGSRLMKNSKVLAKVLEIRQPAAIDAQITLGNHLNTLEDLRDKAKDFNHFGPAIRAEIARGRVSGLYNVKEENVNTDVAKQLAELMEGLPD